MVATVTFRKYISLLLVLMPIISFFTGCTNAHSEAYSKANDIYKQASDMVYYVSIPDDKELEVYTEAATKFEEAAALFESVGDYLNAKRGLEESLKEAQYCRDKQALAQAKISAEEGDYLPIIKIYSQQGQYSEINSLLSEFGPSWNNSVSVEKTYTFVEILEYIVENIPEQLEIIAEGEGMTASKPIRVVREYIANGADRLTRVDDEFYLALRMLDALSFDDEINALRPAVLEQQAMFLADSAEDEMFEKALAAAKSGDFASSRELFERLPKAAFYLDYISAYEAYIAGEWLAAADILKGLIDNGRRNFEQLSDTIKSRLSSERPASPYEDITQLYSADSIALGLYNDCVNYYAEEEFQVSQGLFKLKNQTMKYYPLNLFEPEHNRYEWYDARNDALQAKVISSDQYTEYTAAYDSAGLSSAKGDKFFINYILQNPKDAYHYSVPPFFIAEELDEIRYVLTYIENYEHAFDYNNGTVGYAAKTIVRLKDIAKGKVLFSKEYKNMPPTSVGYSGQHGESLNAVKNDTYARFSVDSAEVTALVMEQFDIEIDPNAFVK